MAGLTAGKGAVALAHFPRSGGDHLQDPAHYSVHTCAVKERGPAPGTPHRPAAVGGQLAGTTTAPGCGIRFFAHPGTRCPAPSRDTPSEAGQPQLHEGERAGMISRRTHMACPGWEPVRHIRTDVRNIAYHGAGARPSSSPLTSRVPGSTTWSRAPATGSLRNSLRPSYPWSWRPRPSGDTLSEHTEQLPYPR